MRGEEKAKHVFHAVEQQTQWVVEKNCVMIGEKKGRNSCTYLAAAREHVDPHCTRGSTGVFHHRSALGFVLVLGVLHTEHVNDVGRHFLLGYNNLQEKPNYQSNQSINQRDQ